MSYRIARVNELIKKELSFIISKEIDDPRIRRNMVTLTKVETSRDLHYAKVYFVCMDKGKSKEVIDSLNSSKGLFLAILKKKLAIRYIPLFTFIYDSSIEKTNEVLKTIRELDKAKENATTSNLENGDTDTTDNEGK